MKVPPASQEDTTDDPPVPNYLQGAGVDDTKIFFRMRQDEAILLVGCGLPPTEVSEIQLQTKSRCTDLLL